MHSNLASFKKPKIQFSQFQDAQTPNKPVSKQLKFIMPTFKTPSFKMPSFVVSRLVLNMRNKKYCKIAEQFNMAKAFLVSYACQRPLPGALVSYACRRPLPGALVSYACRRTLPGALVSYALQTCSAIRL
jgi:hypothetical protein